MSINTDTFFFLKFKIGAHAADVWHFEKPWDFKLPVIVKSLDTRNWTLTLDTFRKLLITLKVRILTLIWYHMQESSENSAHVDVQYMVASQNIDWLTATQSHTFDAQAWKIEGFTFEFVVASPLLRPWRDANIPRRTLPLPEVSRLYPGREERHSHPTIPLHLWVLFVQ